MPKHSKKTKKHPLIEAATKGELPTVRRLIHEGVDINTLSDAGCSALFTAVENRHLETVHFLLQNGADTNARSYDCPPVLMAALQHSNVEIVQLLLEHGADANTADYSDQPHTVLTFTAEKGDAKALRLLLDGSQSNDVDVKSLLMLVKEKGHDNLALAIAEERGYRALADWLRKAAPQEQ